jgi:hypothetical protein
LFKATLLCEIFREAAFDTLKLAISINPDGVWNNTGLTQAFEKFL